jgi:hypothetical protein
VLVFGSSLKKYKSGNVKYSNETLFFDLKTCYWYLLTKMAKGKELVGIVFEDKLYFFLRLQ